MARTKRKRKGSPVYKAVCNEVKESCKALREVLKEHEICVK